MQIDILFSGILENQQITDNIEVIMKGILGEDTQVKVDYTPRVPNEAFKCVITVNEDIDDQMRDQLIKVIESIFLFTGSVTIKTK